MYRSREKKCKRGKEMIKFELLRILCVEFFLWNKYIVCVWFIKGELFF